MSKVFQILNGFCYYDYTPEYKTASEAAKDFPSDIVFVDAPDYVFTSWGFDDSASGDDRFIKPIPPEGWEYNELTGHFVKQMSRRELRENAYNTQAVIRWEDKMITVTEAARLWQYYAAEDNKKADELSSLIKQEKNKIRDTYPDDEK